MRKLIPLTALAFALALPTVAAADDNGRGNGGGRDKNERSDDRGRGEDGRGARGQSRGDDDDRGQGRGQGRGDREDRPVVVVRDAAREGPNWNRRRDGDDRRVVDVDDGRVVVLNRDGDRRRVIVGCPPGLAKKDNGCLPPGQARKIERDRYDYLWGSRNDDDDYRYRYDDGYLYRTNQQGSLLGYLPVLGGALSLGNMWPSQYDYQPVSRYQSSYFGLNDQRDYRYADGAVYGLDPRTQAISQVAALLTGQQFNVGQPMPAGYDVYNVPYGYRDQYADSADAQYRYNDGYVYQVDPTTQLVQAVIQLLT